jgi:hypothetical protein
MTPYKFALAALHVALLCSLPSLAQVTSVPVTVVNTAANPVPTRAVGTTNVVGTVALTPGSTVRIGNSATAPVPTRNVDNPARIAVTFPR